ncbi:MAG: restriction endonuclease subunit S [Bacillota bacterium]
MVDGPCKLPEGWRWMRLGEVCLPTEKRDPTKNPLVHFMYVDISAIDSTVGKIVSPRKVLGQDAPSRARKVIRAGDVIFATTRPYLKNIALVSPDLDGQICSTGFCVIRANREFAEPEFLFHLCRSDFITDQLTASKMRGASYPAVTDSDVYNTLIPLPPLEEQRRIVAKVEALMERVREARRLRAEAQKDTERLMQAALAEVFPCPGQDLPTGWRWVRLGDIFHIQQGASMSPKRRKGVNPKPFLRTKNVCWGYVEMSDVDEMDFTDEEISKLVLKRGDLLVCEGGDVGRTAIWQEELPLCLYQNHIHRLRAIIQVEPKFYMYWMQTAYQVLYVYGGEESRTAIPNLSSRRLQQFIAPLPPLEEQRRIVAYLDQIQQQVTALKHVQAGTEAELKRLEQAILDRAFRGELQ